MKIHTKIGSKKRLFEIMNNVNKVNLNEDFSLSQENPNDALLLNVIEQLKADVITITNSASMKKGDSTYLELVGKDDNNNIIKLRFVVPTQEGEMDGVFAINDAELVEFNYKNAESGEEINLDVNSLTKANENYKNDFIEIVSKYVDVDSGEEVTDELYEDAVKWIDSVPYKGGSHRMQTGKAYGDEKPTNPDVRVKAPELEKFVSEEIDAISNEGWNPFKKSTDVGDKSFMSSLQKTEAIRDTFKILQNELGRQPSAEEVKARLADVIEDRMLAMQNEGDYPDPMGKKFKPKSDYPKKKKKIDKAVKIGESTDQDQYEDVVFLQDDEADEALDILKNQGEDAAMQHLMQWHDAGNHMGSAELGNGSSDQTYEKDGYVMSWNFSLGYIGLQYDLSQMNEVDDEEVKIGTEPEAPDVVNLDAEIDDEPNRDLQIEPDFKAMGLEPEANSEIPDDKEEDTVELTPSGEYGSVVVGYNPEDIEQLAQDKEEAGDMIQGGLADDKSPLEFSSEQIAKGIKVEMEHTNNPLIAVEIVMDHLVEDPEYYGTGEEDPEQMAQQGAEEDAETADDEVADELLGYTSHNVGDEISNSEDEEDKEETDELLGYKPQNVADYEGAEIKEEEGFEEFPHSEPQGKYEVRSYDEAKEIDFQWIINYMVNRKTKKIEAGYIGWNVPQGYTEKYQGPENKSDFILVSDAALKSPRQYLDFPEGIDYTRKENWVREKSVGKQEIVDEEEGFDEYQGEVGDRYQDGDGNQFTVRDKVKGGVSLQGQGGEKEIATNDIQFLKKLSEAKVEEKEIITEEQIKMARQALNKRGISEGMTKKDAVQLLIKHNIK